jgi:Yersinia/Haemophilus virulence surface antigen
MHELGVPVVAGQAPPFPLPKAFTRMHTVVRDKVGGTVVSSKKTQCEGGQELRLIKDYSQKTLIENLEDPKVRSGVCAGISRKWMQKSAAQSDFWQSLDSEGVEATIQLLQHNENNCRKGQLMALQQVAQSIGSVIPKDLPGSAKAIESAKMLFSGNAKWTAAKSQELNSILLELEKAHDHYGRDYLKSNSKELCGDPVVEKFDSASKLCESLQNREGYALILTKGADAGHAIAAYFSAGSVRIMDPNHGEVASNSAALAGECLRSHLDAMKHDLGTLEHLTLEFYAHSQPPGRLDETIAAGSSDGDSGEMGQASGDAKLTQNSNNDPAPDSIQNSNN